MSYHETDKKEKVLKLELEELFELALSIGVDITTHGGRGMCTVGILNDINKRLSMSTDVVVVLKN